MEHVGLRGVDMTSSSCPIISAALNKIKSILSQVSRNATVQKTGRGDFNCCTISEKSKNGVCTCHGDGRNDV